ncbi:hypothetical protein SAMN05443634_10397 [Chishuiella changwenlii]|uniref:Uncharacterized protein n=1 Tax=Chishuiella changwenlii TaxID=1434701 RepID=A0A1M6UX04_9FLAO|nr:hypothetical protein SAMN05443634_10397 [Chishuiella changwenlii]
MILSAFYILKESIEHIFVKIIKDLLYHGGKNFISSYSTIKSYYRINHKRI